MPMLAPPPVSTPPAPFKTIWSFAPPAVLLKSNCAEEPDANVRLPVNVFVPVPPSVPAKTFPPAAMLTAPTFTPPPKRFWPALKVQLMAETSNVLPLVTMMLLLASEPPVPSASVPLLTMVSPVNVFAPASVSVPPPIFVRPPLVFAVSVGVFAVTPVPPPPVKVTVNTSPLP